MSGDELLIEVLDAVDALLRELDLTLVNRGKLERIGAGCGLILFAPSVAPRLLPQLTEDE